MLRCAFASNESVARSVRSSAVGLGASAEADSFHGLWHETQLGRLADFGSRFADGDRRFLLADSE